MALKPNKNIPFINISILTRVFLFSFLLLCSSSLLAQRYTANARFFDTKTGLLDNTVSVVFQDETGFIWIAGDIRLIVCMVYYFLQIEPIYKSLGQNEYFHVRSPIAGGGYFHEFDIFPASRLWWIFSS